MRACISFVVLMCGLSLAGCTTSKSQKAPASTAVLKITRVENRRGELVLTGKITNPTEIPTQIVSPDGSSRPEGVSSAYFGTVEIKQGDEWQWLGPWKCGSSYFIPLKPHGVLRFKKETGIPYPTHRGLYRLRFFNGLTAVFEAGP